LKFLLLTILMNILLFLSFRSFPKFRIDNLSAIVVNYYVCIITGLIFIGRPGIIYELQPDINWMLPAFILGFIFIATFNMMARTTQLFSVSVASIAAKMSLVIPVIFSLFIFKIESKPFTWINYLGIIIALIAIFLSSFKKEKTHTQHSSGLFILLMPFLVFVLSGILDTTMNYANNYLLSEKLQPVFPILIFITAALIGTSILIIKRRKIKMRYIIGGIYLGVPNYFSVYFLLKGLSGFNNDGAVYFPVLNVGIILFSSLAAMLIFREKLQPVNKLGLILSILAIYMLSYQELSIYFKGLI